MVGSTQAEIIREAAAAQRRYLELIRDAGENPRYRLELIDCRVRADAELRGEFPPRLAPPIDMNLSVRENVDIQLEAMRPRLELEVIRRRATRRLGGCGLAQLELSYVCRVRKHLRQLISSSGLTQAEFASAIGVAARTLERWLAGVKISRERKLWIMRLESVTIGEAGRVIITVRT